MGKSEQTSFLSDAISTTERLVQLFGFHDLTSFFIVVAFLLVMLAFAVSGAIFLVKKRKERNEELLRVVTQVQKELKVEKLPRSTELPKPAKVEPEVEIQPLAEVKIPPERIAEERIEPILEAPAPAPVEIKASHNLGAALKNTRSGFMHKLSSFFTGSKDVSDEDFAAMEAILFGADIGARTTQKLLDAMRERAQLEKKTDPTFIKTALKDEMKNIFAQIGEPSTPASTTPKVILFVGVNGAGKTTSIGKLGAQLIAAGNKVILGAGDTYRAAAVQQLSLWGERIGAEVVRGSEKSDPASVLFDTIKKGKEASVDVILCDTAGRLHTKNELMDELAKVKRVVNKAQEGAPHEVFLVVDATMGQNAIMQAREFAQAAPLTGVILSKLDGSAKGGVALGIVDELKIPIRYIGIGEQVGDLREFSSDEFVNALFEEV